MTATQEGEGQEESVFDNVDAKFAFGVVFGGLLLGAYATWITADILPHALTFIFVGVGVGGTLYRREDIREQLVYAGYVLAGLLFLTPVMMILPDLISAGVYGVGAFELLFMTMNLVLFVVFAVPAALVAFLSYRLS